MFLYKNVWLKCVKNLVQTTCFCLDVEKNSQNQNFVPPSNASEISSSSSSRVLMVSCSSWLDHYSNRKFWKKKLALSTKMLFFFIEIFMKINKKITVHPVYPGNFLSIFAAPSRGRTALRWPRGFVLLRAPTWCPEEDAGRFVVGVSRLENSLVTSHGNFMQSW